MKIQRISEASEQVAAFAENHPNTQLCSGRIEKLGGVPKCIDLFWISQNYHDLHDAFMGPVDIPAFNKAVFGVLRRGGLYVIADHSAGLQPPDDATERLHRIGALQIRREVEAAGLVYADSSPAMRNPADTHTSSVFARGTRFHTDRFVLKFRKP
jgi:predicted methyltransferase